ncbi:MAG: glycine zipper 2TM domain-containing protein [Paraprevotella sp.]|nr:glycine zipper 2TM domain-containing protein [Paraprevotella sp.]
MSSKKTLCELFESNKAELQQTLTGIVLPKDLGKAQKAVSLYLEKVFDSEGEFRQNLTQSEDFILEAAISLLNAQQKISSVLTKEAGNTSAPKKLRPSTTAQETTQSSRGFKADSSYTLVGAASGAIAGKLLLGGWGTVFGAIAGVALSAYMSNKMQAQPKPQPQVAPRTVVEENPNKPIDVDCFIGIVHDVCESVDNLIGTFRAQVNRVVQKYESQEKPTLDKEYRPLLESIQSLVGYERNHDVSEEKYIKKVQERIEDLAESLDNYDITLENYSDETASWFDKVSSPNATELKVVFPAVIKNGILIIPGKIFIPA